MSTDEQIDNLRSIERVLRIDQHSKGQQIEELSKMVGERNKEIAYLRKWKSETERSLEEKNAEIERLLQLLRAADHILGVIRNAPGNTLNPHEISQEAFETHSLIKDELKRRSMDVVK